MSQQYYDKKFEPLFITREPNLLPTDGSLFLCIVLPNSRIQPVNIFTDLNKSRYPADQRTYKEYSLHVSVLLPEIFPQGAIHIALLPAQCGYQAAVSSISSHHVLYHNSTYPFNNSLSEISIGEQKIYISTDEYA